uniref:Uncharacterized protein n=1 Tax=Acrobeloides nanus TaxID=290746 RepID=A0A914CF78_9BILA
MSSYERTTVTKEETTVPATQNIHTTTELRQQPLHTSGVNSTVECQTRVGGTNECQDDRGFFEKVKDAITGGDNPAKKAEHYAEKAGEEAKKEAKLACEAQKYANKAAEKANKYASKAEEKLMEKERACEKQESYTEKARIEAERLNQCKEADLSRQAQELKCAGSKLQQAH